MTASTAWMQTFTGRQFFVLDPQPEDIDIRDIAHALSMQCRYAGHTSKFYSVAEHSLLISAVLPPELALVGLLHDAAEAYIQDIIRPLKLELPNYRDVEHRLEAVLFAKFGIPYPLPPEIKDADRRIVVDEQRQVMWPPPAEWHFIDDIAPLGVTLLGLDPARAEQRFLLVYEELTGENVFALSTEH